VRLTANGGTTLAEKVVVTRAGEATMLMGDLDAKYRRPLTA
jgi:hypothetical protein